MHIAELSESISGRYSIVLCPVVCERHSSSHTQRASLMFTLQTRGCLSLTHIVFTFKAQREHQQSVTGPRRRVAAFWMTREPISEPLTSRWRFWMTREPISEPLTSRWRLLLSIPSLHLMNKLTLACSPAWRVATAMFVLLTETFWSYQLLQS